MDSALMDGVANGRDRIAVCLLPVVEPFSEWCDDKARVNPPRPSCVGNRIVDVGSPCS